MSSNLEKYKGDIKKLLKSGEALLKVLNGDNKSLLHFRESYEVWYSEAFSLVKTVLPDRAKDFELYYNNPKGDCLRIAILHTPPRKFSMLSSMTIDVDGVPATQADFARSLFINQLAIVESCEQRFESSLFDIKQVVQADLFDSELDAARELNKNKFTRGAGAIAGVVLEAHLSQVCDNHQVKITKKSPTISNLNDALKDNNVIEVPDWRFIQFLGDIRNKCDHKKTDEPTKEDVDELITGVGKITKTLF